MRGFLRRTPVEQAVAWIDQLAAPGIRETIPLAAACGRVLAGEVIAERNVPEFDRAAMDGIALRAADSTGAGDYNPLEFTLTGESLPGRPFAGSIGPHQAARIMTGAPIPTGADAVVPAEFVQFDGDRATITAASPQFKHVGRIGEDIRAGSQVLPDGRCLRPQDVGVIASLGIAEVAVIRRPRVRIVVTGNELAPPGRPKTDSQIYEANSAMLRGLIARDGGELDGCVHLRDERDLIRDTLAADQADIILVSGGSSVGAEDHAPGLVAELGELAIHGIAMRPSSPTVRIAMP